MSKNKVNVLIPTGTIPQILERIKKKLHLHTIGDWYDVPKAHLKILDTEEYRLIKEHGSVEAFVRATYPEHTWDSMKFPQHRMRAGRQLFSQSLMGRIVRSIFPDMAVAWNARTGHGLVDTITGAPLEIDIFLPELKLGFEYQEPHHYFESHYGTYSLSEYKERDKQKKAQAQQHGLTIITVPFWWDWSIDKLVATIKQYSPNILKNVECHAEPIDVDPPEEIIEQWDFDVPDLGVPMLAMPSPQAKNFNPTGWWIFEKYDGIRAIWHPSLRVFFSRWGNPLAIPYHVRDSVGGQTWLDGEIWFGREKETRNKALKISAAKVISHSVDWDQMKVMVFDSPSSSLRTHPYRERYSHLLDSLPKEHPYIKIAEHQICTSKDHIESMYFETRAKFGEGIIVRDPDVHYIMGYSRYMFKHKGFNDAEAQVIAKHKDSNLFVCLVPKAQLLHNASCLPSDYHRDDGGEDFFEVEMKVDEEMFEGDQEGISPGNFVSFRYAGEHNVYGPPLNPRIYRVRSDIDSWDKLLHNKLQKPPADHERIWKRTAHMNNWTNKSTHKQFFDEFARRKKFDPQIPENWYNVPRKDILDAGGKSLLAHYDDSFVKALTQIYPDIGLDIQKFKNAPKNFWKSLENHRLFFENFAKEKKFDPLIASNWYSLSVSDIERVKGGSGILQHYQGSYMTAVTSIFPFIGLDKQNFISSPKTLWTMENKKKFFDRVAAKHGFDPLVPDNWYNFPSQEIRASEGGDFLLKEYGGSVPKALADMYGKTGINLAKFKSVPLNYWREPQHRRDFFDNLARHKDFEPLMASRWYTITKKDVLAEKGGASVLRYYNGSHIRAILSAYPDIGLQEKRFH